MTCLDPKTIWPNEAVPNVRYKDFSKMVLFTAGDEDQFERKRSYKNGTNPNKKVSLDGNVWANLFSSNKIWKGYNLNASSTINTFDYLFNKFKKGIFVKIVDNTVVTFLPFSKHGYKNDWGNLMEYDPNKYRSMIDFMRYVSDQTAIANDKNYKFKPDKVSRYTNQWYANNCLIRYEHPLSEGDTNVVTLRHMFDELCATREVPDIELFINRRDFPLLTRNGTEPYYNIFGKDHPLDSKSLKLISEGMCPILSMCTSDMYADIVMPTHEDWARVASIEGVKTHVDANEANNGNSLPKKITFPPQCKDYSKYNFNTPWEKRIPTAVFRGGSTGCGVSSDTTLETFNQRLVAAKISYTSKPDKYNVPLITAGITKWNLRPRKILNEKYLQTIDIEKEAPSVLPLTPEEQSKYKYLINIDGHVSAFRLSLEMSMGCCILLVKSTIPVETTAGWEMWFSHLLKPYVHYVPVKSDLSDLIEKIQWCRDNDEKCKEISKEALKFYQTYLSRESILDYMQNVMVKLKLSFSTSETVYSTDPLSIQQSVQSKYLFDTMNNSIKPTLPLYTPYLIPKPSPIYNVLASETARGSYGWSKGYSMFLKHMFRPKVTRSGEELNETWELRRSTITLKGVFDKRLFENKKSTVDLYSIAGSNVVKKSTSDAQGMVEHINEAFISDTCINNLLKVIPNFAWSFVFEKSLNEEGTEQCTLLNEYIEGETFSASIKNKMSYSGFSSGKPFKNVLEVLFQIILSIQFAQEQCGFIHNDLTPWNIIIQTLKEPITIRYPLFSGIYKIITKHVPVIIDYGKSHVATSPCGTFCLDDFSVGNVIHYGVVNMFNMIECQDVFSIIIYSCLDMLTVDHSDKKTFKNDGFKNDGEYDEQSIIKMLNFFSPVELKSRKEALSFIYEYKKYENLTKAHETINLDKSPIEFIKYCTSIFTKEKVAYGLSRLNADEHKRPRPSTNTLVMDFNNPRQIFDEAFAQNIHDVYLSFLNVPLNLYKCTLPQPKTKIELYMVAQSLTKCLKDTLKDYKIFAESQNQLSNESYRNGVLKFENAINFITTFYSKEIGKHGNDSWVIPELCENNEIEMSRNYFRTKQHNYNIKPCTDLTFFKKTILNILNWTDPEGSFEIKAGDRSEIVDQLKFVLESTFKDKQISANNNTYLVYKQ